MKKFDEDKLVEVLAVTTIIALVLFLWWLVSFPKIHEHKEVEETTQIVEKSVESVEKVNFEIETTELPYTEKEMTITAYCPCEKCCGKSDGITASGKEAEAGRTVAVDPRYIPFGTEIIIDGKTYIAEDCGGAIKGDRIDIYFDCHSEAVSFGKQTKIVRIIE